MLKCPQKFQFRGTHGTLVVSYFLYVYSKDKKDWKIEKKNAEESIEIEQIMSDFCLGARHCARKFGGISIANRKGV